MAGLRVNELDSLKKMDVSSWSEKKKENYARNIGECQIDSTGFRHSEMGIWGY